MPYLLWQKEGLGCYVTARFFVRHLFTLISTATGWQEFREMRFFVDMVSLEKPPLGIEF